MDTVTDIPVPDIRDMYAIHTLFRREFSLAPGLIRGVADGDTGRSQAVYGHMDLILRLLALHHEMQASCLRFRQTGHKRGQLAPVVLLDGQHAGLHEAWNEISVLLPTWRETASAEQAEPLAAALERLAAVLEARMAREEEKVLWPRSASLAR
jgi:Hemerythrin HHE cation binding domain